MSEPTEISALISLLDDPDQEVYQHVFNKLTSFGPAIIPSLESAWEQAFDSPLQSRLSDVIHHIQFDGLKLELKKWIDENNDDLLYGMFLINRYQYPDLEIETLRSKISQIRREIWLEMTDHLNEYDQVNVFNQVFYGNLGFGGKPTSQDDPNLFYLSNVIETKKGNAVSLGLLYSIISQQLDIPVYGVILPQHFIVAYTRQFLTVEDYQRDLRETVLFYINPLNKGVIFSRNEINIYLKKLALEQQTEYFVPASPVQVIKHLLQEMKTCYEHLNAKDKVKEMLQLLHLFL